MCLCGLRLKKNIIFHILYIIVAPLCPAFLKRIAFYKAQSDLWSEKRQTTSATLHRSKLAFESSEAETYLQALSQKRQTVLAKLELPHFIETAFVQACKQGYSPASPPRIVPHTLEYLHCTALEQCCKYNLTTDF